MGFLKSKPATQTSVSENVNNPMLTSTYAGTIGQGTGANNILSALLTGQGDTAGAQTAYNNYLQTAGYQPAMNLLERNLNNQAAANGMLNSGATLRALQTKGTELNQQFYNNYLQQLQGLSGTGLQAGGLVANTGQKSTSQSVAASPSLFGQVASTVGGVAGVLSGPASFGAGTVGSRIFSDRRLKENVRKVGELPDGLGIYHYRYLNHGVEQVGVMADEVVQLRPWALGPKIAGYQTVNYEAL